MKKKQLTRRNFLKAAGVTSASLALAACGLKAARFFTPTANPSATPSPTANPSATSSPTATPSLTPSPAVRPYVLGMHCFVGSEDDGQRLLVEIPQLERLGINTLIAEVDYAYAWQSHPELRYEGALTFHTAQSIGALCRQHKIRIIPEIDCIGHQSWEGVNDIFLETYPQFDETPGLYPGNQGIYCRSWCTSNAGVYPILFDLIDEMTTAFGATGMHVGMDEIFLIGEDACPLCHGKDRSVLLADSIMKFHQHIVTEKNLTLYMWGDRLINGRDPATNYDNEWETAMNDTHRAVDLISKDIVICDWHYDPHPEYGSIPYFLEKGLRVLPTSYHNVEAAAQFIEYSLRYKQDQNMLGHLYTNWGEIQNDQLHTWPPMLQTIELFKTG